MKEIEIKLLQQSIFRFIESIRLKKGENLVDVIGEALDLQKGATYKRISGETSLSFRDLVMLCKHFDLSLDGFISDYNKYIPFKFIPIYDQPTDHLDYFKLLYQELDQLNRFEDTEVIYLTNEIPFFHLTLFPRLFFFKMFVWNNTIWYNRQTNKQFDIEYYLKNNELDKLRKQVILNYYSHPVTEIWDRDILYYLIQQIVYFTTYKKFADPSMPLQLMDDLLDCINTLHDFCKNEQKSCEDITNKPAKMEIYLNELGTTTSTLYFRNAIYQSTYVVFDYPNFLMSQKKEFCEYTIKWLYNLKSKSTKISGESQKDRHLYFEDLRSEINFAKAQIQALIQSNQTKPKKYVRDII